MSGSLLNASTAVTVRHTAAFGSEALNAEVAAHDALTGLLFVAAPGGLDVIDPDSGEILATFDTASFGNVNSVTAKEGVIALAIESSVKTDPGKVLVLDVTRSGDVVNLVQRFVVDVGALPDQIAFTPDGTKLLTANEGEPNSYSQAGSVDPEGSVSIIDVATGAVQTATFAAFNGQEAALKAAGVRIFGPGATVAQDLEPEYVAVDPNDPTKAYVTLQEANAIAVLDIPTATFTAIVPLGFKDYGVAGNEISASDQDNVFSAATYPGLFGMYNPDAIVALDLAGTTYLITANEGDARDYTGFSEEARISTLKLDPTVFPDDPLDADTTPEIVERIGRLTVTRTLGDTDNDGDYDQLYAFGGRSFSVWDTSGNLVFDSGNQLDQIIATQFPGLYDEDRDDNKGVEPESLTVGQIEGQDYLFVGLERANATIAFRIDGATDFEFAGVFGKKGDVAPEVITFIPGTATEAPRLVTPNEASATTAIFTIEQPYTLQLLHFADGEAGLLASQTAPNLAALVDAFEDDYANTLILAGGDNYIPGPFFAAGTDPSVAAQHSRGDNPGAADIEIHNRIGVEASTIGNHEFDLGTRVFSDAVGDAAFPYLSANLDFSADPDISGRYTETVGVGGLENVAGLSGRIVPSAVVREGNELIGLVGVTTQIVEAISSTGRVEVKGFAGDGTETNDMAQLAALLQPVINDLVAQGVNKIVLMSHLQQIQFEQALAPLLSGVDIILAAGSNTRLGDATDVPVAFPGHAPDFANTYPILTAGADGKSTLIVNTDNEYTYLGRLVVQFDANGEIITGSLNPGINGAYAATTANVAAAWGVTEAELATTAFAEGTKGEQVADITEAVQAVIAAKDGETWGFTSVYLEGERNLVRNQETNLGNLTADANLAAAQAAVGAGELVVSLKNGGGIRTAIGSVEVGSGEKTPPIANPSAGKEEGEVSTLDIENSLRFNNRLMVFDTTAAGLKAILEHGVAVLGNQGRFPQLGGISFSYDADLPAGSRILNLAVIDGEGNILARLVENGVANPDAPGKISVVTLNFLADGGDSYPIKANGENFRYLLADGTLGPVLDESLDLDGAANLPANALGEQKTLKDYLAANHATRETAFDEADTPESGDTRIQNLNARTDAVFLGEAFVGTFRAETFEGTGRDDTITAGSGNDTVLAGAGDDLVRGDAGNDSIDAGSGDDTVLAGSGRDTVAGGEGRDSISGDDADDLIDAGGGNDTVLGGAGYDTLVAGAGADSVDGGTGSDRLSGDAGNDTIAGGIGNDTLSGGADADSLDGGAGNDSLAGDGGADTLRGGLGADRLLGGSEDDLLDGGSSDDRLFGEAGNDTLLGDVGADLLVGGTGNDSLDGGFGSDTLKADAGDDTLTGGLGNDLFVFGPGIGDVVVTDFTRGDRLRFEGEAEVANFAAIDTNGNGRLDFVIEFETGGTIALLDYTPRFGDLFD